MLPLQKCRIRMSKQEVKRWKCIDTVNHALKLRKSLFLIILHGHRIWQKFIVKVNIASRSHSLNFKVKEIKYVIVLGDGHPPWSLHNCHCFVARIGCKNKQDKQSSTIYFRSVLTFLVSFRNGDYMLSSLFWMLFRSSYYMDGVLVLYYIDANLLCVHLV